MSGNPFRRPQASKPPDESAIDDSHELPNSPPRTKTGKPKKRVQIISPPQSPVDSPERPRRLSDGKTGSPPPPPVTVTPEDVVATHATSAADEDLKQALENTQRNSDGAEPLPAPVHTGTGAGTGTGTGTMRAPFNPFARTLATSDAHYGLQRATEESGSEKQAAGGPPKMNVDMFKNLLLTGSASPSPSVAQGSSTETSSVSREFDPAQDSPRTSFEQQSVSDDEPEGENEHAHLMGPTVSRPQAEGPPPPPKHRHGKALGPKGPQTVSFADFHESIPAGWQHPSGGRSTPPMNSPLQSILRPSISRSPSSDLNKPLPAPPEARLAAAPQAEAASDQPAEQQTAQPPQTEASQAKKAPPPPPPASRRQAQASGRSRSGSNLTQNSIQEEDEPPLPPSNSNPTPTPKPKAVPPPPPSRRAHNPVSAPPASTPPTTEPSSPIVETKPTMPPPPPRRHPSNSKSGAGSHKRSSSNASNNSIPRHESAQNSVPPPAPPPRRNRNSTVDHSYRRSSGQSFGSETSSLRQIDESAAHGGGGGGEQGQRDMLADLAALQAEVDALRANAG